MVMDCAFQKAQIKNMEQMYYGEMVNVREELDSNNMYYLRVSKHHNTIVFPLLIKDEAKCRKIVIIKFLFFQNEVPSH